MRFLLDENVPFDLLRALEGRAHTVQHVAQVSAQELDEHVLARAVREQAVLVTFDSDFGRLIFYERHTSPPGVIYLQSHSHGAAQTVEVFLNLLDAGDLDVLGRFIIIDQQAGLRVLPLT